MSFLALVLYPLPLFPHRAVVGSFVLHSDLPITPAVEAAALEASRRTEASLLFRKGRRYRVFLANDPGRYAFFCRVTGLRSDTQALALSASGSIIVSARGVSDMRLRSGGTPRHSRLEGTLAGALAHEVAHMQIDVKLGRRAARSLPRWKTEGWADYAANLSGTVDDPSYDLLARARLLLDDGAWMPPLRPVDRMHFRWQVMVEYLASVRELDFAEICGPSVTEEQTWSELIHWLSSAPPAPTPE